MAWADWPGQTGSGRDAGRPKHGDCLPKDWHGGEISKSATSLGLKFVRLLWPVAQPSTQLVHNAIVMAAAKRHSPAQELVWADTAGFNLPPSTCRH